jgi:3-hydroxyacyl-CoA dehydrogenase
MVVVGAQQGMWDTLDAAVRKLQDMNMRMRYSPKPVVIAPVGYTFGGGCEDHHARLACGRCLGDLYRFGRTGRGRHPCGGGTKEYMRRIINPAMKVENVEVFPFIQKAFLQIGQAKVATSAEEARGMGILGPQDRVVPIATIC